jgi:hypothetical protein
LTKGHIKRSEYEVYTCIKRIIPKFISIPNSTSESSYCSVKAENPCFLPSTQLLTPQQFQKDTPTKNEIKTPNQQIKQPNK